MYFPSFRLFSNLSKITSNTLAGRKTSVPPSSLRGEGRDEKLLRHQASKHGCEFPHLGKPFHERRVASGLLHVVVKLHPHQQSCTDAQHCLEQHRCRGGERAAAVEDVVQDLIGYARLCGEACLRQASALDFFLEQFTRMYGALASIFSHVHID